MYIFTKQKQKKKKTYGYHGIRGKDGRFGLTNNTTVYTKDNIKNLLYITGISTQSSVMIYMGKEQKEKSEWIYLCV